MAGGCRALGETRRTGGAPRGHVEFTGSDRGVDQRRRAIIEDPSASQKPASRSGLAGFHRQCGLGTRIHLYRTPVVCQECGQSRRKDIRIRATAVGRQGRRTTGIRRRDERTPPLATTVTPAPLHPQVRHPLDSALKSATHLCARNPAFGSDTGTRAFNQIEKLPIRA